METVSDDTDIQDGPDGIPTIAYYNISGGLDYENELLRRWGMTGKVRLVGLTSEDQTGEDFIGSVRDSEGVVVEYFTVTEHLMDELPRLRVIGLQSIGTDMVDKPAATRHGIAVTNAPGFCQQEVATTAVGMIIDLARKITYYDRDVRAGSWEPLHGAMPHRIQGMTVGLVFFGGIPRLMVPVLVALGMKVIVYAPTKTADYLASFGAEKVDTLDELLTRSDVVSLHTPLIPETRHLISDRELRLMKPTAFLVNTSRGPVVDEAALIDALDAGTIRAAALDVLANEREPDTRLTGHPHCLVTPHAAYVSREANSALIRLGLDAVIELLIEGREPTNLVRA